MSKAREDCDFEEPWPMFADEDEPWKDLDRLLKLDDRMDYQYEIADALGTSPSSISYWLDKAKEKRRQERLEEGTLCQVCEEAEVPGGGSTCGSCLDDARDADAGIDYDHYPDHLAARLT